MNRSRKLSALALISLWLPSASHAEPAGPASTTEWYGDSATRLVTLNQGWSSVDREWFYHTTQGSRLMPYAFFIRLEQADSDQLFREERNIRRFRCIPQQPGTSNQDGLPVGFVADEGSILSSSLLADRRSLGFTCAACHTAEINYKDTAIRIDGGPALADMDGLLNALTDALKATLADKAKFDRFRGKVLGAPADDAKKTELKSALEDTVRHRVAYQKLNKTDQPYGFARLDAFGRIFNTTLALVDPTNGLKADAPVSYPHLWDAPYADKVQWTGNLANAGLGSLSRNVGEVVGVFAAIDTTQVRPPVGYISSVHFPNLLALEERLKTLLSPQWSDAPFPAVDKGKADEGHKLYNQYCVECHREYSRTGPVRAFASTFSTVAELGTDPASARNILEGTGKTGILKGGHDLITGVTYGDAATADQITKDTITRVMVAIKPPDANKPSAEASKPADAGKPAKVLTLYAAGLKQAVDTEGLHQKAYENLQYRTRPLNGIWATAPFLHNGSVPTLYDLLLPEAARPAVFYVGRREFDPIKVGYMAEEKPGTFRFDTTLKGNSNKGHNYGTKMTEEQRWQLVEYLKTL